MHEAVLIWEARRFNSTDAACLNSEGLSARKQPCNYFISLFYMENAKVLNSPLARLSAGGQFDV